MKENEYATTDIYGRIYSMGDLGQDQLNTSDVPTVAYCCIGNIALCTSEVCAKGLE